MIDSSCAVGVFAFLGGGVHIYSKFLPCVNAHTILALGVLMQKDHTFEASLGYLMKSILKKEEEEEEKSRGREGGRTCFNLFLTVGIITKPQQTQPLAAMILR